MYNTESEFGINVNIKLNRSILNKNKNKFSLNLAMSHTFIFNGQNIQCIQSYAQ